MIKSKVHSIARTRSQNVANEFTRRGLHAEAAFERLQQFRSDLRRLDDCDVMRLFIKNCMDREESIWIFHTIYDMRCQGL